jgi:hypothetical protein
MAAKIRKVKWLLCTVYWFGYAWNLPPNDSFSDRLGWGLRLDPGYFMYDFTMWASISAKAAQPITHNLYYVKFCDAGEQASVEFAPLS